MCISTARAQPILPDLQWHYRVIVVFTGDASQARKLAQTLRQTDGITERDIAWFVVDADDIDANLEPTRIPSRDRLERLHTRSGFQTVLVGKDGGIKARQDDELDLAALFDQIDQMPMRQREMREQR